MEYTKGTQNLQAVVELQRSFYTGYAYISDWSDCSINTFNLRLILNTILWFYINLNTFLQLSNMAPPENKTKR